jgi:hypothetical protein
MKRIDVIAAILVGLSAVYQGMSWKTIQTRWQWRMAPASY